MLTGCGGASATPPASLPTTPVAGQVNSYVGGQGNSPSQASEWSVTINRSTNTYSYTNPNSGSTAPTVGALTNPTGGFLILLDQNGYGRIDRQHSSGGRPPSDLVEVNPALLGGGGA